jgi:predicted component of type VI protein secretion system
VDIKIGQFISPQMKSSLEAFVQRVVEENEPRLIKPRVEVMNSKTNSGSLQVVVAGFIEGESDPLEIFTTMHG